MTAEAGVQDLRAILKRLVGNAGLLLAGRTTNAVLGLASIALASRSLGASQLGVLVLIHAFAQLLGELVRFQSWQSVLQYGTAPLAEGRREDFQRVLRFTLFLDGMSALAGLSLGVAGAVLFAGPLGWGQEHIPAAALYMLCVAAIAPSTPLGVLRLFDRFSLLARQTALVSLVRLIGSAIAFGLHAPLEAFLLAWALGQFTGFAYLNAACLGELGKHGLLRGFRWRGPLTEGLPGAWRFAWHTNLSSALDVGLTHVATLVVGALLGPSQAAFWKIGRQVADGVAKPARLLAPALYPELARLRAAGDRAMMTRVALRIAAYGGGLALALLGLSLFAGPALLSLVMGPPFAAAADVMTWQVGAAVIGVFALPLAPMLVSLGKPGRVVVVQAAVSLAFVTALFAVTPVYGLTGAGAALVTAETLLALGLLVFLRRG